MKRKTFATFVVAALSLGTVGFAAQAQAQAATSPTVSLKVTAKDLKTTGDLAKVRFDMKLPGKEKTRLGNWDDPFYHVKINVGGSSCPYAGDYNEFQGYASDSATIYDDFDWKTTDNVRAVDGKPGTCVITAKLSVTVDRYGNSKIITSTAKDTFVVRAPVTLSTPKAASKVKKGKTATLSGKATYKYRTYQYASPTKANVAKGAKLVLQQRVAGSKSFKNVKTIKVGSKGKWSVKVKPRKTTQYRVVLKKTSKYYAKTSSAKKITVTKK